MTFNSKAAMADVMGMFSSPMHTVAARTDSENSAVDAPASGGFAIFEEEAAAPKPAAQMAKPKLAAAPASSGFAIFEEEPTVDCHQKQRAKSLNSPLQVASGFDSTGDGKIDSLDLNGDGKIDAKIVPVSQPFAPPRPSFGSPTMTFNTKAAMHDVQQMFSSPLANDDFDEDYSNTSSPTEKFDGLNLQGLPVFDEGRPSIAHGPETIGANMSTILESSEQGGLPSGIKVLHIFLTFSCRH